MVGIALRVIIFPWGLFALTTLPSRWLHRRARRLWTRVGALVLAALSYLIVGLPATLVVTAELLIAGNEWLVGEQANYELHSDFGTPAEHEDWVLPGPTTPAVAPVAETDREAFHQYLVELYSPVILQKVAHRPKWDVPVALDFDGNHDPRDNVRNERKARPHHPIIYGELTAVTKDSYYLTYSLYHIKDYDHPIRQWLTRYTYHDNDNEGFHIRVDRKTMELVEAEMWFHNRFLVCNRDGVSRGSEPVHGKIRTEGGTHLIVYAQSMGHGVRCAQKVDEPMLGNSVKILRFRGAREKVPFQIDRKVQTDVTYDLKNFDAWYERARGPLDVDAKNMFEEGILLGKYADGRPLYIARFIAGEDYALGSWSRPKPMWSWDDGWDELPVFVWHFFPSISFETHVGSPVSHDYEYNRPSTKTFDMSAKELGKLITSLRVIKRGGHKWKPLEGRGGKVERSVYWRFIKEYVNYLFHSLG